MYALQFADTADGLFSDLETWQYLRFEEFLEKLREDPHRIGKPMKGSKKGLLRAKFLKNFRVLFQIDRRTNTVIVHSGDKRSRVYNR
ncbi:hypothetical protein AVEN_61277-1 [Araneus ventricosus]|uniref:Uncharacterized protein n=1 Tax=Araneus ventricosus TaxID=182803 RepID=A0A4Y2N3N3_ARAVE|nr:hypothetical protein AVEN_61277-1 [Araneus ventricosus]